MNALRLLRLALLGSALALGACSSFNRDFKTAAQPAVSAKKTDPFGGPWDGVWTSEKHKSTGGGRLRCVFTKVDESHYRARFWANWLCFASGYEVTFHAERHDKGLFFDGEQDLGAIFGGVYRYRGQVKPEHFSASFASAYDTGRFEMGRPMKP